MMDKVEHCGTLFDLRARVWFTRDACPDHIPQQCPLDCPNAGKHDAGIGALCECGLCSPTTHMEGR
jgi:hypothetical protein